MCASVWKAETWDFFSMDTDLTWGFNIDYTRLTSNVYKITGGDGNLLLLAKPYGIEILI